MTAPTSPQIPRAFLISTGSEMTEGDRVDTNAPELSHLLTQEGFRVTGHMAVPDDRTLIIEALTHAATRADLVVMTGGIGPTEDDLCREALAEWLGGAKLHRVHRAEAMMRVFFTRRGRPMPERNLKQALLPVGAVPLLNFWGTAMGILVPANPPWRPMVVVMPGVPREWRAMWERSYPRHVAPAFPERRHAVSTTLHVAGMAESEVNAALLEMFGSDPRVGLGLLASLGIIRVRVAVRAAAEERAALLAATMAEVRRRLPSDVVFAEGADALTFEQVVVDCFRAAGKTLALAESCTGGGVAARLTSIPNSSQVLVEGWVTYSNDAKRKRLGVREETLKAHGAVSEAAVREMADGARVASGADVAFSVSGIAGPSGGTAEKPVGLVWFGWADSKGSFGAVAYLLPGDREGVRTRAENVVLDLARRWIEGAPMIPPAARSGADAPGALRNDS